MTRPRSNRPKSRAALTLAGLFAMAAAPAGAQELRVGLGAAITSLDPQFHVVGSNSSLARNIFDGLVNQDDKQRIIPGLAAKWSVIDPNTWEFTLREGARFHDGSAVTAEDVAASLRRVAKVKGSPSSFLPFIRPVTSVEVVNAQTLRLHTASPYPLLPNALSRIAILPARLEDADTASFNAGTSMIGSGPYRFVSYKPGDRVELEAAEPQPGQAAPAWKKVSLRFMTNDPARVAALLSGDIDMIENVPSADIERMRKNDRVAIASAPSNRVMYLHPDQDREQTPFITGKDGKPFPNPLRDVRVRRALSLAVDRRALVARLMDGEGAPAGQVVPQGYFGYVPSLAAPALDQAGAKKLLAEAGLPDGFTLTLHATNDRYPNDDRIAQALAQMWTRVGIQTKVETQPGAVFFTRASNRDYTLIMGGAAAETGEASSILRPVLATYDTAKGDGSGNRGRYSSERFDALLHEALATVDDTKREELIRQATSVAMEDQGIIPLFFLANSWATGPKVTYTPRSDGWTLAINAAPKP